MPGTKKTKKYNKVALITGITGQDGSYLADLLLEKNYEVHGIIRRASLFNTERIDHLYQNSNIIDKKLFLHYGDLSDGASITRILRNTNPTEIYNLGAQSHVQVSFEVPEYTADVDAIGTLRLIDAIKENGNSIRFYQAGTSEMFGNSSKVAQNELTPFYPCSPYAAAKIYSHWITRIYREAYNMYACVGILFNHESERRGMTFVTRKITSAAARIRLGLQDKLYLGNLQAKRDWGYAPDYVYGMWLMLQQDEPDDYVLATGETHTVEEFCKKAFEYVGLPLIFEGHGVNRKGIDASGRVRVEVDKRYFRPVEVDFLLGNPSKAKKHLGWKPKVSFEQLIKRMVANDLERENGIPRR